MEQLFKVRKNRLDLFKKTPYSAGKRTAGGSG